LVKGAEGRAVVPAPALACRELLPTGFGVSGWRPWPLPQTMKQLGSQGEIDHDPQDVV
jgi:hypothetical protein